jgi:SAM-dependent methyltransferase
MNRWDFYYLLGKTPWDSGITPPEIVQLVEGGRILPGRALDVGCGTGTNVVYLAQHGFDASGADVSARAIGQAQAKIRAARINARVVAGNLLDQAHFPFSGPFDFVMDIGVMHLFDETDRERYAAVVAGLLRSGGYHFTFGFKPGMARRRGFWGLTAGPLGIAAADVERAMAPQGVILLEAHDAGITPEGVSRTGWYLSRKR